MLEGHSVKLYVSRDYWIRFFGLVDAFVRSSTWEINGDEEDKKDKEETRKGMNLEPSSRCSEVGK